MRSANQEAPRRVDDVLRLFDFDPIAQQGFQGMVNDGRAQCGLVHGIVVLGRYHHFVYRNRSVVVVGDGDLGFGIGAQPREDLLLAQ